MATIKYLSWSFLLLFFFMLIVAKNSYAQRQAVLQGGKLPTTVNIANADDYGAFLILGVSGGQDTLFFTSSRPKKQSGQVQMLLNADIYFSTRPISDRTQKAINEGWSEAQIYLSNDAVMNKKGALSVRERDRIVFAAPRRTGITNSGQSEILDIWQMTYANGRYENPEPLDDTINKEDAWDSQPSLSPDGRVLFFVSDREDKQTKKKGYNIWYSYLNANGQWQEPRMVPNINTDGDEMSPHCGVDGKFYFASNWNYGLQAFGANGLDIYRAEYGIGGDGTALPKNFLLLDSAIQQDARRYNQKVPSGLQFNSSEDDCFPFVNPDRSTLFISHGNRDSANSLDIYAFALPKPNITLRVIVKQQLQNPRREKIGAQQEIRGIPMIIIDKNTGIVVQQIHSGDLVEIEAEKNYSLTFAKSVMQECFQIQALEPRIDFLVKQPFKGDTTVTRTLNIIKKQVEIRPIIFAASDKIPYFITGYWKPNISANYNEFLQRFAAGWFKNSPFVDPTDFDYASIIKTIEERFDKVLFRPLTDSILPQFQNSCGDTLYLRITIHGYTDSRGLAYGLYPDKEVTVGLDKSGQLVTIPKGHSMSDWTIGRRVLPDSGQNGNILLSKLRAYYMFQAFDSTMKARSALYAMLRRSGRIIDDIEGFGIDKEGFRQRKLKDDPQSRKVEIYLDIIRKNELATFARKQGGQIERTNSTEVISGISQKSKPARNVQPEAPLPLKKDSTALTLNTLNNETKTSLAKKEPVVSSPIKAVDEAISDKKEPTQSRTEKVPEPVRQLETKPIRLQPLPPSQQCFGIRYCALQKYDDALSAKSILAKMGIPDANIYIFRNPIGIEFYHVYSGCFASAAMADQWLQQSRPKIERFWQEIGTKQIEIPSKKEIVISIRSK